MIHTIPTKKAFTMIELVFVIVLIGILASLSMSSQERDLRQEAADDILSSIRYTQDLALHDNMQERNPDWQRKYWRIVFSRCSNASKYYYMIGSDSDRSGANNAFFTQVESAIDPSNGNDMFANAALCNADGGAGISERLFITKNYGITNVVSAGGCTGNGGTYIGFDHLGRPQYGFGQLANPTYAGYMNQTCSFTFTMSNNTTFTIDILPETGYAQIRGQDNS